MLKEKSLVVYESFESANDIAEGHRGHESSVYIVRIAKHRLSGAVTGE